MTLLRVVYLVSVLVALCINWTEYEHAKWVCREAWRRQWSLKHNRQAKSFMGEELLRVWVQTILIVPAVVGLSLPYLLTEEKRQMLKEALSDVQGVVAASIVAHIVVAVLLAVKSVKHRHDRLAILDISAPPGGEA